MASRVNELCVEMQTMLDRGSRAFAMAARATSRVERDLQIQRATVVLKDFSLKIIEMQNAMLEEAKL